MSKNDSRLVYSTERGRLCPTCGKPVQKCACKEGHSAPSTDLKRDGFIRIKRETRGRGGKTVTTISGFDANDDGMKELASRLKNTCGTGGSVKDGVILIQGDHREAVRAELEKKGFRVKLAGG